jgi:Secretion system C-terminal sorting domain/X-Pro dipeptidyl-peptidase C-terminal non-catalytic domain
LFEAKFRKNEILFETPALLQDAIMAGTPYAYLYYSSTASGVCQYNMQIWDVRPSGEEKLVTRINWTDRYYTANQVKEKNVSGQAYGHKFLQGNRIRVKVTNLDNVTLYRGQYLADPFLRTNPFMLPVLEQSTNRIFINASSRSYIELPLINFVIGIQQISAEVPGEFSLQQNYPNPFNPATKIRFSVPSTGKNDFLRLSVFNITGREVTVLIDENYKAGTYEIDWDASGYSTGVYFYKMTAGDFTSVKKMMLVK